MKMAEEQGCGSAVSIQRNQRSAKAVETGEKSDLSSRATTEDSVRS